MSSASSGRAMLYCGTETDAVVVLEISAEGTVEEKQRLRTTSNPLKLKFGSPGGLAVEWVALHPSKPFLYALTCFWDKAEGEAKTYAIDATSGLLKESDGGVCPTGAKQPCHADFSPNGGEWLAVAHYLSGAVSVLDCRKGVLMPEKVCCVELAGERPGPGEKVGFKGPLAHGAHFAPSGSYLAVCDAGQGKVWVYGFDQATGMLAPEPRVVTCGAVAPGQGCIQNLLLKKLGPRPRHLAFHPTLDKVYVISEFGNAITWHAIDRTTGQMGEAEGQVSSLASSTPTCCFRLGLNGASEIQVSRDGRFLYASNRGFGCGAENSVAVFALDAESGAARLVQTVATERGPRHFAIGGSGSELFVGLQGSRAVARYSVDAATGALKLLSRGPAALPVDCVQAMELPAGP